MAHLEQKEITHPHPSASPYSSRTFYDRLRRRERLAAITWQSARLFLLAWSLLCFYCSLRLCLSSHTLDLQALGINVLSGLWTWWLVCRTSALPIWGHRLSR